MATLTAQEPGTRCPTTGLGEVGEGQVPNKGGFVPQLTFRWSVHSGSGTNHASVDAPCQDGRSRVGLHPQSRQWLAPPSQGQGSPWG